MKNLPILVYILIIEYMCGGGIYMLNENNLVSKSKTIIDLKNLDLNLQELKVLDVYLSKINPKNIDTAKVRFTKKEYCKLVQKSRTNI